MIASAYFKSSLALRYHKWSTKKTWIETCKFQWVTRCGLWSDLMCLERDALENIKFILMLIYASKMFLESLCWQCTKTGSRIYVCFEIWELCKPALRVRKICQRLSAIRKLLSLDWLSQHPMAINCTPRLELRVRLELTRRGHVHPSNCIAAGQCVR